MRFFIDKNVKGLIMARPLSKEMYERIKEIIDDWDPYDLLDFAPDDEYSSEIKEIAEYFNNNKEIRVASFGKFIMGLFDFDDIKEDKRNIKNLIMLLLDAR